MNTLAIFLAGVAVGAAIGLAPRLLRLLVVVYRVGFPCRNHLTGARGWWLTGFIPWIEFVKPHYLMLPAKFRSNT